jgi:hypothetical protein
LSRSIEIAAPRRARQYHQQFTDRKWNVYNRFARWRRIGVFMRNFAAQATDADAPKGPMADATFQAESQGSEHAEKVVLPRYAGSAKGRVGSRLQVVATSGVVPSFCWPPEGG